MASYLRPRRGKKATAESQGIVLKRGEVFFECPDTGVGTGTGRLKVGDGTTAYASLPYFLNLDDAEMDLDTATIAFTNSSAATDPSNDSTYLTNIAPTSGLATIFTNLKQLLTNFNSEITQLNNDYITVNNKATATIVAYTISASGWNSSGVYSALESLYPHATYNIEIYPISTMNTAQYEALSSAGMVGYTSDNNIKALGTVPTIDISVMLKLTRKS